jgi:hypothetical protein
MIRPDDLTSPERCEQTRRSIAMLTTGAWALKREDALLVLDQLTAHLRAARVDPGPQPDDLLRRVQP